MFAYEYMLSVYLLQVRWMAAWQNGRKGLELFFILIYTIYEVLVESGFELPATHISEL